MTLKISYSMDCVRGEFFPASPANTIASESFSTNYIPTNARFIYLYINVFPSAIFSYLFVISRNLILSVFLDVVQNLPWERPLFFPRYLNVTFYLLKLIIANMLSQRQSLTQFSVSSVYVSFQNRKKNVYIRIYFSSFEIPFRYHLLQKRLSIEAD